MKPLLSGMSVTVNGTSRTILVNDCGACDGDCSQFHQVSFHYLTEYYALLNTIAHSAGSSVTQAQLDAMCNVYTFLQSNIDSLWQNARNSNSGLFNCDWDAQYNPSLQNNINGLQGAENSAMSAFSLFASLPMTMV